MNRNEECFAFLQSKDEITSAKLRDLLNIYKTPENIFLAFLKNDAKIKTLFDQKIFENLVQEFSEIDLKNYIQNLEKQNIVFLSKYCNNLSETQKNLFDLCTIDALYFKGDLSLLDTKCLAIVGSRMPDSYGKKVTEDFATACTLAGVTIVSGLAAGVDSIAHNTCLKNGGKTIAVLGGGFNNIYPAFNNDLANVIIKSGGLLISEYAPNTKANAFQFPQRNRIIAGVCSGVLITQMSEKSGAMHTKNYAIEYGKELFIVPSDCYRESSFGNLRVIEELPETIVTNPLKILESFGITKNGNKKHDINLNFDEQLIINVLKDGEKHFCELQSLTNFSTERLSVLLTTLRISGIIRQSAGNIFSL